MPLAPFVVPMDVEPAQIDDIVRGDVDVDSDGAAAGLHAADGPLAVDGDGFADVHRAEPAGIETVDLAARRRLGERPGEGQARRCPRAGIAVVSHARHPAARRLRIGWSDGDAECKGGGAKARKDVLDGHGPSPSGDRATCLGAGDRAANSIFGGSAGQFRPARAWDHWPSRIPAEDRSQRFFFSGLSRAAEMSHAVAGSGHGRCFSRSSSNFRASCSTPRSSKRLPMICSPMGSPLLV